MKNFNEMLDTITDMENKMIIDNRIHKVITSIISTQSESIPWGVSVKDSRVVISPKQNKNGLQIIFFCEVIGDRITTSSYNFIIHEDDLTIEMVSQAKGIIKTLIENTSQEEDDDDDDEFI